MHAPLAPYSRVLCEVCAGLLDEAERVWCRGCGRDVRAVDFFAAHYRCYECYRGYARRAYHRRKGVTR
jgi:hypothetical protein